MPAVTWSFSALLRAPPDAVFAWMSDFREDDHDRPAFRRGAGIPLDAPAASRRAVVSREGNVVPLRDTWGRREMRVVATVDAAAREVRIRGGFGFDAVWRAAGDGGGTRVTSEGRLAPGGLLGLLLPLFRRRFLAEIEADFRGHVADVEDALAPRAEAPPS